MNIIKNLTVCVTGKTYRGSGKMCRPYTYLLTHNSCSFKAYVTFSAFKRFLKERNLKLKGRYIIGEYKQTRQADISKIKGLKTRVLNNGEYTPATITTNKKGVVTVHIECSGIYDPAKRQTIDEYREFDKIYG